MAAGLQLNAMTFDGRLMKQYRVSLRGENFVLPFQGRPTRLGFYATRIVQANNRDGAEMLAVDLVRRDRIFANVANNHSSPPTIFAGEISEVASDDAPATCSGYTFFLYDDEEEEPGDA